LWQFDTFDLFISKMLISQFLFYYFIFLKKKEEKTKNIYMLGWPNHPIGGGWPPRLAWGDSATPKPADLGAKPPLGPLGVVRPPPDPA
jgi:hypothetical protein